MGSAPIPAELMPPVEEDPAEVRDGIAAAWRVPLADLEGRDRGRRANDCRAAAALAMRALCPSRTLEEIGALLGNRPRWDVGRLIARARVQVLERAAQRASAAPARPLPAHAPRPQRPTAASVEPAHTR